MSQACSAWATCTASARPNSGDISGAVTKSLPDVGHRAELAAVVGVVAQARLVQRQRHEAVEGQPAAVRADGRADPLLQLRR